jgi:hypothetical protein
VAGGAHEAPEQLAGFDRVAGSPFVAGWFAGLAALLGAAGAAWGGTAASQRPPAFEVLPPNKLSIYDLRLNCDGLQKEVVALADQMKRKAAEAKIEAAKPPDDLYRLLQRARRPGVSSTAAMEVSRPLRLRAEALVARYAERKCGHVSVATLLQPAQLPKDLLQVRDRCGVRFVGDLEDCVEDIAQWRCRAFAGHGRNYLDCLEKVALGTIAASGFRRRDLAHWGPSCGDKAYKPATCTVFTNDTTAGGTETCHRLDEATIEVCAKATPAEKPADRQGKARGKGREGLASLFPAAPPRDKSASRTSPATGPCHRVTCGLGTCHRLCAPPG